MTRHSKGLVIRMLGVLTGKRQAPSRVDRRRAPEPGSVGGSELESPQRGGSHGQPTGGHGRQDGHGQDDPERVGAEILARQCRSDAERGLPHGQEPRAFQETGQHPSQMSV